MGYILKRVNHSVRFGKDIFHTNNIESLCRQIKRYCNYFSGISIEILNNKFNNDKDMIKDYLDGFIFKEYNKKKIIMEWQNKLFMQVLRM